MDTDSTARPSRLAPVLLIFSLVAITLVGVGWHWYLREADGRTRDIGRDLNAMAGLKAGQIEHWLTERVVDVEGLAQAPLLAREVKDLLASAGEAGDPLLDALRTEVTRHHYLGLTIVGQDGRARVAVGPAQGSDPADLRLLARALQSCTLQRGDLSPSPGTTELHIDLVAPLSPAAGATCPGVVVAGIDAEAFLAPLLGRQELTNAPVEFALARRSADTVEVLYPRHMPAGSAATLGRWLTVATDAAAALGPARGATGGVDARGIAFLGGVAPVTGTEWMIAAETPEADGLAQLATQARWMAFALLMTLVAATGAVALVMLRRDARHENAEARMRADRDALLTHFSYLTRFANDIVLLLREDGRLVQCNERALDAYGWSRDELLGMTVADLRDPSERDEVPGIIERAGREAVLAFEAHHRTRAGLVFPVHVSVRRIDTAAGRYFHAIVLDITEKHQTLAQVSRLSRLYAVRSAANSAVARGKTRQEMMAEVCRVAVEIGGMRLAWFGLVDPETERVVPHAADGPALGYLEGLVISAREDVPEGQGPSGRGVRSGVIYMVNDIATAEYMTPWRNRAASFGLRASAAVPVRIGGQWVGVLTLYSGEAAFFDETERDLLEGIREDLSFGLEQLQHEQRRREAEARLRASEERFRNLFTTIPVPLVLVDAGTRGVLAANAAAAALYRAEPGALADVTLDALWPSLGAAGAGLAAAGGLHPAEHRRLDGSTVNVEVATSAIQFDGRPACLVAVQDVTERQRLEQEVRQSQRMEAIGRLAGGVAHDFNNLLTVIRGYSELALMQLDPRDPLRDGVEEIQRAGGRAADLTRQLLAFSRRQVLRPRPVNLNAVITDTAKMLQRLIGEHISLVTDLQPGLWTVEVDPGQIDQVVMNLAVNARDAMPDGGTLRIETGNISTSPDRASGRPCGDFVRMAVQDSGTGIPVDVLPHIFEPFFTTKELGKGTGLGLSTVHGIVSQSGGFIEVETRPEGGSRFVILLPRVDVAASATPQAASTLRASTRGTILIVEDEAAVRQLTRAALERAGHAVRAAATPAQAMAELERDEAIDLLLTDVVMPQMSGPQLAAALLARRPGLRVVYMSGYAESPLGKVAALPAGARLLLKPFTTIALQQAVHEALLAEPGSDPAPRTH